MCSFIIYWELIVNDLLLFGVNDRVINFFCFYYFVFFNDVVYFCKCVFMFFIILFNIVLNGIFCILVVILVKV